jgi:hypothetical protein
MQRPASHTLPQLPQLFGSFRVFTQTPRDPASLAASPVPASPVPASVPPQRWKPPGQAHCRASQISPAGQRALHAPQLAALDSTFTHKGGVPHAALFEGQTQLPP